MPLTPDMIYTINFNNCPVHYRESESRVTANVDHSNAVSTLPDTDFSKPSVSGAPATGNYAKDSGSADE
ncbi:hypothetical protein ARMGADRAFT_1089744 [Armillaria gallica]|uniref:Uncharacterized protein n=1 Tax=Armillaria gallica TaxID=47427 RepID=A0A2H3CX06_ARMGA|nr:hypothetical protein ARMGADRAFT_1089744 [Armillaria gallica]